MKKYSLHKWSFKLALLFVLPSVICAVHIYKTVALWKNIQNGKKVISNILIERGTTAGDSLTYFTKGIPANPLDFINRLFEQASEHECAVKSYTPYINETASHLKLYTIDVVFNGSFINTVRFIGQAEDIIAQSLANMKIASVSYRSIKTGYSERDIALEVKITIQQLFQ